MGWICLRIGRNGKYIQPLLLSHMEKE